MSSPTVPSRSPRHIETSALTRDRPPSAETAVSPSSIRLKYSAGPNEIATHASGGASSIRPTVESVPATNEPMAAVASAAPARPCFAIGWGGGGGRTAGDAAGGWAGGEGGGGPRPAVGVARGGGPLPKVIGIRSATVVTEPMPGSTPISVPTRQPTNAYRRFIGGAAMLKPGTRVGEKGRM